MIQPGFQQKHWEAGEEGRLVRQGPAPLGPSPNSACPNSQDHWENTYPLSDNWGWLMAKIRHYLPDLLFLDIPLKWLAMAGYGGLQVKTPIFCGLTQLTHCFPPSFDLFVDSGSSPAAGILKPSSIFLILAASAGAEASWQMARIWKSHSSYDATLSCPVLHSFLHGLQLLDVVGVVLTLIGEQIHFLWPSKAPKRCKNRGSTSRLD